MSLFFTKHRKKVKVENPGEKRYNNADKGGMQ